MKFKKTFLVGSFMLAAFAVTGSYYAYTFNSTQKGRELLMANVEALATPETPPQVVYCYCKIKWFSPNICTVEGSGGFCGGDPCSNHDGNCR